MSEQRPETNQATARRDNRFPVGTSVIAALSVLLLGLTTVWGAMATNFRVSEVQRTAMMRERVVAELHSLDLEALRRGRAEYLKTCTACHGPNGEAKPNLGKDLRLSEFLASKSDMEMTMFLKLGRSTWDPENTTGVAMPPKGGNPMITDADLADIVQFLRFLQADYSSPSARDQ